MEEREYLFKKSKSFIYLGWFLKVKILEGLDRDGKIDLIY
jgi:hypothetical protein